MPRTSDQLQGAPGNQDQEDASHAGGSQSLGWASDKELAAHMRMSAMSLYRVQNDPELGFPQPTWILGMKRTSLDEVEQWRRDRRGQPRRLRNDGSA